MSQRTVQRVVTAGVLAILLGLAGSTPVEARELRGPASLLGWLSGLWEDGVSMLWPWGSTPGATEKTGPVTDPNGKPLPNAGSCGSACEAGPVTDPDG